MRLSGNKTSRLVMIGLLVLMLEGSALAADAPAAKATGTAKSEKAAAVTNDKAADVNGVVISMATLDSEFNQTVKQMESAGQTVEAAKVEEAKKELLESLINQELLFQESKKQNIVVEEENVNESLGKVKANFADDATYQSALKEANISEELLVTRIKRGLAINSLVDRQVTQKISITDAETKEYYDAHPDAFKQAEQVQASHILVKVAEGATEADLKTAKEKIDKILVRVKAGEDFATLAKETSDCPSSADGGNLGYFEKGKMVQEFEDAAFTLKTGEVSGIVKTDYGYHIIKVTDRKEATVLALDTVKEDLQTYLKKQKTLAGVNTLIETLKTNSKIEKFL